MNKPRIHSAVEMRQENDLFMVLAMESMGRLSQMSFNERQKRQRVYEIQCYATWILELSTRILEAIDSE